MRYFLKSEYCNCINMTFFMYILKSVIPVFRRCTRNVPEFCSTSISDISTLTPEQPSGPMISSHEAIRQSA